MQEFAICVRNALAASTPKLLEEASWHAPYFDWDDEFELLRGLMGGAAVPVNEAINGALLVSARRCARVSYLKQDDVEELLVSHSKGVQLADMGHYSPMEHQVRPITHLDLRREPMSSRIHAPMDLFRDQRTVKIDKLPLERMWCGNLRGVVQFRKLLPGEDNAMLKRVEQAAAEYESGDKRCGSLQATCLIAIAICWVLHLLGGLMHEPEMPHAARGLLEALVEIEDQAIEIAHLGGCKCNQPYPHTDRSYPVASFDSNQSMGKPYTELHWEVRHQPGCPMEGQRGVGYASDPKCGELSPESHAPCYLAAGHTGAHEASRGPAAIASWAHTIKEDDNVAGD